MGRRAGISPYYVALSGTPGTGKSSVARRLPRSRSPIELSRMAIGLGTAQRKGPRSVLIDLPGTIDRLPAPRVPGQPIVGHLAHFLPVRYVILLRCHPIELARRLSKARRGSRSERAENVAAEAIDLVLAEARDLGRRTVEIDTSGRSIPGVAHEVARILRNNGRSPSRSVDWLADPEVTDYLLRHAP